MKVKHQWKKRKRKQANTIEEDVRKPVAIKKQVVPFNTRRNTK